MTHIIWEQISPRKKAIGTKWVYKMKCKGDGSIQCCKVRLVVRGYAQVRGIDYDETFTPTYRTTMICTFIALEQHIMDGMYIDLTLKLNI